MHISVHGTGSPLLLLHGWAMHGGIFASLLPYLASHFTIHSVDLPGHGRSVGQHFTLDDTIAELSAYVNSLDPVVLVGWSLGGAISIELALRVPKAVRAVISIASSPCFVATDRWPFGMTSVAFKGFCSELTGDWESVVDRFLALEALGSPNEKAELRWLRAAIYAHGKPDPAALISGLDMLGSIDLTDRLIELRMPSLWLGGLRDRIVPPQAIVAAAELSGGRVEILSAAHAPFLTHPELVASLIIALASSN